MLGFCYTGLASLGRNLDEGTVYTGVCIDTSGVGICAEQSAIAAMITAGSERIKTIVATWKDENEKLFVIAPCGHCREFMHQVSGGDLAIEVILSESNIVTLAELLPHRDSWKAVKSLS